MGKLEKNIEDLYKKELEIGRLAESFTEQYCNTFDIIIYKRLDGIDFYTDKAQELHNSFYDLLEKFNN